MTDIATEQRHNAQRLRRYLTARGCSVFTRCDQLAAGQPASGRYEIEGEEVLLRPSEVEILLETVLSAGRKQRLKLPRVALANLEFAEASGLLAKKLSGSNGNDLSSTELCQLLAWLELFLVNEEEAEKVDRVIASPLESWIWTQIKWDSMRIEECEAAGRVRGGESPAGDDISELRIPLSGTVWARRDVGGVKIPALLGYTVVGHRLEEVLGQLNGECRFWICKESGDVLECSSVLEFRLNTVISSQTADGDFESVATSIWRGELLCSTKSGKRLELWVKEQRDVDTGAEKRK